MADIFEILKGSGGKLEAKEIIIDQITHVISSLHIFKEMLGVETQKEVIESIKNDLVRIRWAVDDLLRI